MMLSVDRFSEIQEGVGIAGADDLLKKVALRLGSEAEAGNFVARVGMIHSQLSSRGQMPSVPTSLPSTSNGQ